MRCQFKFFKQLAVVLCCLIPPSFALAQTTPQKKTYPNTSLTACPTGEQLVYFINNWIGVGDTPETRGGSWCAAAEAAMTYANSHETVLWRIPYQLESCNAGVSWSYSHAYQNGTRFLSPPYRDIAMVCEVFPMTISLSGPSQAKPMAEGGEKLRLTAQVLQNGAAKPDVAVGISVQSNAGGSVALLSGTTNASGVVQLEYTPPQSLVGESKVDLLRADCGECENSANMSISVQATPPKPALPQTCPASPGQSTDHPILPATGTKILREPDWQDGGLHSLGLTRHYSSRWTRQPDAGLGGSWSHNHLHRVIGVGSPAPVLRTVVFGDGAVSEFRNSTPPPYVRPDAGGTWQCSRNTWCFPTQPVFDPNAFPPTWTAEGSQDTLTDTADGIVLRRASDDSLWLFDKNTGLALRSEQRNGWAFQYSYTDGKLSQVNNAFGRQLSFAYDAQNRLISVTAPDGQTVAYQYDAMSRLVRVVYADTTSKTYLYENAAWPQYVTGIVDQRGVRYASYAYDALGRAILSELAGGVDRTTVAYAPAASAVTDALGTTRGYQYQALSGAASGMDTKGASIPGADGNTVAAQTFDGSSLLQSQTDFLGITTLFTWDASRRLKVAETKAANRPEQQTIQTQWHPTFRLPELVTEAGKTTAYTYDALGNMLTQTVTDTATGQARTWAYTYTPQGLVASMTDPRGSTWAYGYDAQGNRTSERNPLGHDTTWQYDAAGRVTRQTDPNGLATTYTYDLRGRLTQSNRGGEITTIVYTPTGNVASATQPNGHSVAYEYDAAQRLIAAADNRGNRISYTLDAMGNRVREEVKDGSGAIALVTSRVINHLNKVAAVQGAVGQTTQIGYDANGEPISQTDPLNQTTRQALDGLRRPTATTLADNAQATQAWNQLDQLTQVTDPKGVATQYTRNAFGEVMSETSPDIGTTSYQRDAAGSVVAMTDAKGITTQTTRDALGRPQQVSRGAHQTFYTWDQGQVGYLSKVEDPSGVTTFTRDINGNLTQKVQAVNDNPANPASFTTAYAYTSAGVLDTITYPSGLKVTYKRNAAGQIIGIDTQAAGRNKPVNAFVSSLTYTALGQPKAWAWANGDSASRTFDTDGRMTATEFATYGYDTASRITSISQSLWATSTATGAVTLYTTPLSWTAGYDNRNRLTQLNRAGAETTYTYDANSNRLSAIDKTTSDTDLDGEFDDSDFSKSTGQALNIDPASNKLLGFTQTFTKVRGTRTLSILNTNVAYTLDANGALTSDGLRDFEYDEANRLAKVKIFKDGEAAKVRYLHNALGQRVFKSEPEAEQTLPNEAELGLDFISWLKSNFKWLFAAGQANTSIGTAYSYADGQLPTWALMGEYDNGSAAGKGRTEYIWLPTEDGQAIPIGIFRNGKFFAIHTDHLGTPRLMTNEDNKPVWQWPYSAFGNNKPTGVLKATPNPKAAITNQPTLLKATAATELNLRFPGQYADEETGLFYNYWRNYRPAQGRYDQPDWIGLAGGWSRFAYVENDPLMFTDPMGLQAMPTPLGPVPLPLPVTPIPNTPLPDLTKPSPLLPTWNWDGITWPSWMESRSSDKERATDVPSWSRQYARKPGESCSKYAERILEDQYGCDDPRAKARGPGSEYSKIKKHCERGGK